MKISILLCIVLCHHICGQENNYILPDEAVNHVWHTTDSDAVIFDQESTIKDSNAREKDADSVNNACDIKELSVASIFLLISAIILNQNF